MRELTMLFLKHAKRLALNRLLKHGFRSQFGVKKIDLNLHGARFFAFK